jgi:hypothetical protein
MNQKISLPSSIAETRRHVGGDDALFPKDLEDIGVARRRRGGLLGDDLRAEIDADGSPVEASVRRRPLLSVPR